VTSARKPACSRTSPASAGTPPAGATWTATGGSTCTSARSTPAGPSRTCSSAGRRRRPVPPRRPGALRISSRPTGSLLVDLDNDGRPRPLRLQHARSGGPVEAGGRRKKARRGRRDGAGAPLRGCALFRNDGGGRFTDVSADNGACPPAFGGRSAAALDFDGDGLLDLLVGEDPLPGYNGSPTKSSRLFRNLGGLRFEDATRAAGIPAGVPAYGVAAADVNGDTWPDLFLCGNGANVLFLNDGRGGFREAPGGRDAFAWPAARGDDMVCGVSFADVNRDGLPDAVLGPHFESAWRRRWRSGCT
jgi:hypothetical protein